MTLIAILSSLIGMNPGLGIVVAIVAVPALVRTCFTATRRGARGQPLSVEGKVALFLLTVSMTVIVIVAAGAAFFLTCLAIFVTGMNVGPHPNESALLQIALTVGLVVSLVVVMLFAWLFWNLSHRTRNP
jgi:hypothetical protein